jgi:molybdate transport system regulatory protein
MVRFRVDFGSHCSVGIGKIELLEAITASGSLVRAARQMRMSYRRAWLLLHDMNTSFDHPVADASVGGRGGGGVRLTAFGSSLVAGYRRMEVGVQSVAADYLKTFSGHVKAEAPKRAVRSGSIRGRAPAGAKRVSRRGDTVLKKTGLLGTH